MVEKATKESKNIAAMRENIKNGWETGVKNDFTFCLGPPIEKIYTGARHCWKMVAEVLYHLVWGHLCFWKDINDHIPFNPEHSPSEVLGRECSVSKINSTLFKIDKNSRTNVHDWPSLLEQWNWEPFSGFYEGHIQKVKFYGST